MKKFINILSVLSIIAVISLVLVAIILSGKNPRSTFLFEWIASILIGFSVPLLFGWFSLSVNKDKLKPRIWLTIYSVAMCAYIAIILSLGFIGRTADLPAAIREDFSRIDGLVRIVKNNNSVQVIEVKGVKFDLPKDTYNSVNANIEYTFIYLSNSKYVINVLDENGFSLLK